MEPNEMPFCTYETDITAEKFAYLSDMLGRKTRVFPIIYIICGALLSLLEGLLIFVESLFAGRFFLSFENGLFFFLGLVFIALGILIIAVKIKARTKGYETYLRINPDPHVHMDFFSIASLFPTRTAKAPIFTQT